VWYKKKKKYSGVLVWTRKVTQSYLKCFLSQKTWKCFMVCIFKTYNLLISSVPKNFVKYKYERMIVGLKNKISQTQILKFIVQIWIQLLFFFKLQKQVPYPTQFSTFVAINQNPVSLPLFFLKQIHFFANNSIIREFLFEPLISTSNFLNYPAHCLISKQLFFIPTLFLHPSSLLMKMFSKK
jgi:hypothetical protein